MTDHASSPLASDNLLDEAAYWCMRMHAEDCTNEERTAFERWLKISPAHMREYQAMLDIWLVSEHLPVQAIAGDSVRTSPRRRSRRPALAAAALLLLSLGSLLGWQQGWLPNHIQRFHAEDSTREVILADGSRVHLNLDTTLWFVNFRDRRSVKLSEGEAFFEVQHDARHPFVVYAGKGSVTVTGTRFNVWKYADQVVVTLTEGSVKVHGDTEQPDQVTYLSPGLQARYGNDGELPQISTAKAEALAWREGKLVLDDLTLAEALPYINRYLDKPILLADQATADLRIGGIYDTRNIGQLVQVLPKVLPIYLSRNSDDATVIGSRPR
ncbi:FecR family protein [Azotobacter vinelandii]|uniref:FecR family protein n=1 Tax=Azotobacter TaxID=352 RepID=UPI00003898DE|nr:FecR family protein [Azotobacter vinelandii]WKN24371.1 FecR family protein [Azotobacter vinelandii]GLK61118.1 peptide ABC transporter substrate-binding protein [Azotobacter vinelandii]SFY06210.1 FecR family protein [Azotobacter vinelandii]